ncbi:Maf family protein [Zooshikella harenae]|uniref:dTTP/UTP pyrophosphatase n=1 Tax=Zooshikella harenae TaxID=2827238 RepID=A0ABS5Z8J7_9GAMM|nr:Maf family protein [Zooshikella harenae]MBU2710088.1 septum formation inhibitor Maf [Zooshikella harenae]
MIYLASQSPRRQELLKQIGVNYLIIPAAIDESPYADEVGDAYVLRMAKEKANAGWQILHAEESIISSTEKCSPCVLAADTSVIVDGCILGKPKDESEAKAMLMRLSNRTHQVITAVALKASSQMEARLSVSNVTFRALTDADAQAYIRSGEPLDKAGAYAIQGLGAIFVQHLAGSYSGVMGLPLTETAELLQLMDVPTGLSSWRKQLERADE